MSTLKDKLASVFFFSSADDALSAERARNAETRMKLSQARLKHSEAERNHNKEMRLFDKEIKRKRDAYAQEAKPMLAEFDDIAMAHHYYSEASNIVSSQEGMVEQMASKETAEFGYLSKKLISVALNFEALKVQLKHGKPFREELTATIEDAESEDLKLMSRPLLSFADTGVPKPAFIKAAAFDLARSIEDTGKAPTQEPVRGWLDLLKFRTSFSPSAAQKRQLESHKWANEFTNHIEMEEYLQALNVAHQIHGEINASNDSSAAFFEESYQNFVSSVTPSIASDIFIKYAQSSLDASRYACVERMLKE